MRIIKYEIIFKLPVTIWPAAEYINLEFLQSHDIGGRYRQLIELIKVYGQTWVIKIVIVINCILINDIGFIENEIKMKNYS